MLVVFLFYIVLFMLFTIEPINSKKSYSSISGKYVHNSINLNMYFTLSDDFWIRFHLIKSNGCVTLATNLLHKKLWQPQSRVNELILTRFSQFDNKCIFFWRLREWDFHISPRLHLIMEVSTRYHLEFFWIMSKYLI